MPALLLKNHQAIERSGLRVFLECGEADEFALHDGALHLHRLLAGKGLDHAWQSLPGVGHGDDAMGRLARAIAFLGEALSR